LQKVANSVYRLFWVMDNNNSVLHVLGVYYIYTVKMVIIYHYCCRNLVSFWHVTSWSELHWAEWSQIQQQHLKGTVIKNTHTVWCQNSTPDDIKSKLIWIMFGMNFWNTFDKHSTSNACAHNLAKQHQKQNWKHW